MQIVGEKSLPLSRENVWMALIDPEVLRVCIPGCETITGVGDDRYEVVMQAAVGPVKARFKGFMKIMEPVAPVGYVLGFEGSGGVAGFASGQARVSLEEVDANVTLLRYSSDANVGGKLAQVGSRLISSAANMVAERFFVALVTHLTSSEIPPSGDDATRESESTNSQLPEAANTANTSGLFGRFFSKSK